jgi:redox-sensitive bicupin YhaK (pirin superfamily)
MIYFRPAHERGNANFGWLNSKHSFSFGSYYDPRHMGFSTLRVINDDSVIGGAGFDTHGHRNMEIISYVLEGAIEHRDSLNNRYVIPAGDVQVMSAGTGITHSEYNHLPDQTLKFLQIWIMPNRQNVQPRYEQMSINQLGDLTPLVSENGEGGTLKIHADARISRIELAADKTLSLALEGRAGYLHVIEGGASLAGHSLNAGDGIGVVDEPVEIQASSSGLIGLWFDLPVPDVAGR